jgi:hypothetical protein
MRRLFLAVVLLAAAATYQQTVPAGATALAAATVAVPPTPRHLPAAIEPLAPYVEDATCDLHIRPGTRELANLLASTYGSYGATDWASTYPCGTDGTRSEHYDGRAIDWMASVDNPRQHEAAKAFLRWLLASDPAGNRFAMARRLGVMYVIYDNRMWGAWDGRWQNYDNCQNHPAASYDNYCHRTHVHISLSWDGAMGRTSYWTQHVPTETDYGPCRRAGLNWAPPYRGRNTTPCADVRRAVAGNGASATRRSLVAYSGITLHRGCTGPAVDAVQNALGVPATGSFNAATVQAMWRFQARHHVSKTRVMRAPTWYPLLAATH